MRDPVASCAGKERFESRALANTVARRQSRRREARLAVYSCDICGGFHIGTVTPKRAKRVPSEVLEPS